MGVYNQETMGVALMMCLALAHFTGSHASSGLQGSSFAKTFVGTPQYWAPEVLNVQRGGGSYTQAADYWRPLGTRKPPAAGACW